MMQRDERAKFPLGVAVAQNFQRSARFITSVDFRRFLEGIDQSRIKGETRAAERHQSNRGRAVRRRRKHARGCPGRFVHQFLAIEHNDAQISAHQFKGNRAANDAATHDDDVIRIHKIILAVNADTGTRTRMEHSRLCPSASYGRF